MIQDPDLAKHLTVKEFSHFTDHHLQSSPEYDPILKQSLFFSNGEIWKKKRSMITPSQTSSKVRLMFDSINDICHQVVDFLKAESIETNPKAYEIGDLFARSLIDILGACVFGIKVDSFKESNNTYYKNAKEISCLASLGFNVRMIGGLEATTSVINFLAYELEKNPLIQEKLFEEIQTFREEIKEEKLCYETLMKMKYLDMVVSEGLRKWPSFAYHDRICTKDYTMEYETGKTYTFHKGDVIWIPFVDYHRNPKYFLHPENFDPERFSPGNQASIKSSAYLPFGMGPRSCLGERFTLIKVKALIYHLVANFNFELSNKTEDPPVLKASFVGLKTRSGIWIKFRPRVH
ncbi:probable cytochrome P450 9f2 [Lutzomyia longipalpis]|uniref:probable cytochrome P450 9f2 n=1 Tax=Lutzomyia longipalpis TaxID=7200 RepID=UPI002484211C|nr:probable cytochrome P450 9f2 [Lutzomyia longipalpis]